MERTATAQVPTTRFTLPSASAAGEPPEARGLRRDAVRLMVVEGEQTRHVRFHDLPAQLRAGDLLVVNTSAALPAAVDGVREDGRQVTVHFSTPVAGSAAASPPEVARWLVEVRPAGPAYGPVPDTASDQRIDLPGGARITTVTPAAAGERHSARLWVARVRMPDGVTAYLQRYGRPISYGYVAGRWSLEHYQTVFALHPGSAEMPSAARPFTAELVARLVSVGVRLAPLTLHTGVSSLDEGEIPPVEWYDVPVTTAQLVNATRDAGGRVIAVGTTCTRALETVADDGIVRGGAGWTDRVVSPTEPARIVDGLLTGWHAPGASHLLLLEAVAGARAVGRAYGEALRLGYRWHEFGDSCLFLPLP